jgi:hypothetical protein
MQMPSGVFCVQRQLSAEPLPLAPICDTQGLCGVIECFVEFGLM